MPNVLLLVVDTVRADHLSCYGYHRPTSPNLDALAREGVLFENAIAPSSWTQPSHASLLTGQYTHEHHAEFDPLDKRYPTIGEALSRQGYRAGAFSGNLNYFTQAQGFGRGFLHFEDYYFNVLDMVLRTAPGRVIDVYVFDRFPKVRRFWRKRAPEVNAEFFRWVDADRERPFFAFLNYFDVHSPYLLPGALRGRFGTGSHSELDAGRLVGDERDADHLLKDEPGTPERSIDAYDDCTLYADEHLRRLLWGLRERGLADNTLVIVTSDHGEQFMAHGLQGHGNSLYRQLIHVPLVVCWPGHVPAGVRVAQPVSIKALAATVLDLIGVQDETAFDDPSLARLWQDPAAAEHWPHPVAELAINPLFSKKNPVAHGAMKCLVTPDWHLIVNQELPPELYDWKRDPQELHNRAGQKAMAPEIERLEAELEKLVPGWL
jgi:arylsulfatase A-like enzyme